MAREEDEAGTGRDGGAAQAAGGRKRQTAAEPKPARKAVRRRSAPVGASGVDSVVVTDGALAKVVGLSAHEVPGVVGMAPASLGEGIRRILGTRQVDEGVVVSGRERPDHAVVDIHVVVAYGVNIPVVAESVRERVRYAAKTFAGVVLDEVRVHVAGVSRA